MRPSRHGFTLIELLVYIGLLAIVLGLLAQLVASSTDAMLTLRRRADNLSWALRALDTFKDDVRGSNRAGLDAEGSQASPSLVLEQRDKHRTVRYDVSGGTYVRRVVADGRETVLRVPFTAKKVTFLIEGACVTMTLELPSGSMRLQRGHTLTTSATLRCPMPSGDTP